MLIYGSKHTHNKIRYFPLKAFSYFEQSTLPLESIIILADACRLQRPFMFLIRRRRYGICISIIKQVFWSLRTCFVFKITVPRILTWALIFSSFLILWRITAWTKWCVFGSIICFLLIQLYLFMLQLTWRFHYRINLMSCVDALIGAVKAITLSHFILFLYNLI